MIPKDALFLEDGLGDGQVLLHDPRDERLLGVLLPMVVGAYFIGRCTGTSAILMIQPVVDAVNKVYEEIRFCALMRR